MNQSRKDNEHSNTSQTNTLGTIVEITPDGTVFVVFDDKPDKPIAAILSQGFVQTTKTMCGLLDVQVLLAIVDQDLNQIVIVDVVHNTLSGNTTRLAASDVARLSKAPDFKVLVDGEQVTLNATRSLTLQCGKSVIELNADGRISIRGDRFVSTVRGIQAIRGGAIKFN